jgi:hypothetical protein
MRNVADAADSERALFRQELTPSNLHLDNGVRTKLDHSEGIAFEAKTLGRADALSRSSGRYGEPWH